MLPIKKIVYMITMKAEYCRTITILFIYTDGFINKACGTNGRTMQFSGVMQSKSAP